MKSFIAGLPKAELHLHIEGTFEPELMFKINNHQRRDAAGYQRRRHTEVMQTVVDPVDTAAEIADTE